MIKGQIRPEFDDVQLDEPTLETEGIDAEPETDASPLGGLDMQALLAEIVKEFPGGSPTP